MADFNQNLSAIKNAVYGKDVRGAIYDALLYLSNNQGSAGGGGSSNSGFYTLPIASANTLGGVKISSDFNVSSDGKISLAKNKVVKADGYEDSQILNFLHVDANKKIVPIPLFGKYFTLDEDENGNASGLTFSMNGRLWLLDFIETSLLSLIKDATMDSDSANIDEVYNAYSVYFPLSTTENTSLYSVFGGIAEGAFVSAYSIEASDGIRYVQVAIPVKSTTTDSVLPGIATRSKREGRTWTDWMSGGNAGSGSIYDDLATQIVNRSELDVRGSSYSMYLPLSPDDDENADLYNAFNGQAAGVFILSTMVKDANGIVYAVQCAIPARAENAIGEMPCIATRSKYQGEKWFAWKTSGSVYSGGSSDVGALKTVASLIADCLKNVAWANTLGSTKLNNLIRYIDSLSDNPNNPDIPDAPDNPTNIVNITFDAGTNGGTVAGLANITISYEKNSPIKTLPTAVKNNHSFKGWFSAPSSGVHFEGGYLTVTNDMTFYAQFEINNSENPDIPDVPGVDAEGFETVKVIGENEILHLTGYTEIYPYYEARNVREAYPYFDIPMEYEYTYKFEWTANCTEKVQLGLQYYNQNVLNTVAVNGSFSKATDCLANSEWYDSGRQFVLPAASVGNSPIVGMRFHFRKANDGAFVTGAGVTSVTIKRKAGRIE